MAAQSGSFNTLQTVLQMDFSLINIQNASNGWTALHMAIRENPTSKTVTELKKAQVSQVVPDHNGHTADYYSNFEKRLYHTDEHPRRDMLGNLRYGILGIVVLWVISRIVTDAYMHVWCMCSGGGDQQNTHDTRVFVTPFYSNPSATSGAGVLGSDVLG